MKLERLESRLALAVDTGTVSSLVGSNDALSVVPPSLNLTTDTSSQLFIDGQPVTYAGSPVTASFQSWAIFEATVIRDQNVFFGQHSSGVIHRLYANSDWSTVAATAPVLAAAAVGYSAYRGSKFLKRTKKQSVGNAANQAEGSASGSE